MPKRRASKVVVNRHLVGFLAGILSMPSDMVESALRKHGTTTITALYAKIGKYGYDVLLAKIFATNKKIILDIFSRAGIDSWEAFDRALKVTVSNPSGHRAPSDIENELSKRITGHPIEVNPKNTLPYHLERAISAIENSKDADDEEDKASQLVFAIAHILAARVIPTTDKGKVQAIYKLWATEFIPVQRFAKWRYVVVYVDKDTSRAKTVIINDADYEKLLRRDEYNEITISTIIDLKGQIRNIQDNPLSLMDIFRALKEDIADAKAYFKLKKYNEAISALDSFYGLFNILTETEKASKTAHSLEHEYFTLYPELTKARLRFAKNPEEPPDVYGEAFERLGIARRLIENEDNWKDAADLLMDVNETLSDSSIPVTKERKQQVFSEFIRVYYILYRRIEVLTRNFQYDNRQDILAGRTGFITRKNRNIGALVAEFRPVIREAERLSDVRRTTVGL